MRQDQWEADLCNRIWKLIRDELFLDYRFLDVALSSLIYTVQDAIPITATDGVNLFYPREQVLRVYKTNPVFLNRAYLHSVMHCVFRHLWLCGKRNQDIWNIASDIAVEWMIDHSEKPSTKRILSRIRIEYYEHLKKEQIPVTAAAIYRDLLAVTDFKKQMDLQLEFHVDDHRFWLHEEQGSAVSQQAGSDWEKIGRRIEKELERSGREADEESSNLSLQLQSSRRKRSYRDFLKKFMVLREEAVLDDDTFDLNYYTYGLTLYRNMPLIEPLESREVMKILNFIIVIDTSYSTSGEPVRRFLEETFAILSSGDSFFRSCRIHLIQCDNRVQADTLLTSLDDIEHVMKDFTVHGGGGTDFRPAFEYINERLADGTWEKVKGVLYYTDGRGIYPKKRPAYDTVFLLPEDGETDKIPPWAMRFIYGEEA